MFVTITKVDVSKASTHSFSIETDTQLFYRNGQLFLGYDLVVETRIKFLVAKRINRLCTRARLDKTLQQLVLVRSRGTILNSLVFPKFPGLLYHCCSTRGWRVEYRFELKVT